MKLSVKRYVEFVSRAGLGFVIVCAAMAVQGVSGTKEGSDKLQIIYPKLPALTCLSNADDPDPAPCAEPAGYLAIALANLRHAEEIFEAAYQEWLYCLEANGLPMPTDPEASAAKYVSIIEK